MLRSRLEAFAQLGTDLDAATQARLDRGYCMVELLKQGQYQPLDVVDQVLSIYAGTRGHLDDVSGMKLLPGSWVLDICTRSDTGGRARLEETKALDDETERLLEAAINTNVRSRAKNS